jgi:asparagine synthase (glutamine-hydrolysing)
MCGIAGAVALHPVSSGDDLEALVGTMCDMQTHRGPDDSGVVSHGSVCLGSRRLSIIDLSPAGHMPMADDSGRFAIVYNGEVYNFAELRTELQRHGHVFRSHTDTEVVLRAFMRWGEACLQRFIGMFAFAIHDRDTGTVTLVRDRFGIKPLYYAHSERFILFGSEIKALLAVLERPRVHKGKLLEWLLYRNVDAPTPESLIERIRSVLPGQCLSITDGRIAIRQWYTPLAHVDRDFYARMEATSRDTVVGEIERGLDDAVRLRLVSDVPVGTLLSGGLDSSLVTAIAARHSNDLTAFHVSVAGAPELDERRFAETLTGNLGIPFIPYNLTPEGFRRVLPLVVSLSDLPLTHPNSVAYYLICKVAREHGVVVLLSGEGADELYGGYHWAYRRKLWLHRFLPLWNRLPKRFHELAQLLVYAQAGMPVTGHRFRDLLPPTIDTVDGYARYDWQRQCEDAYGFVPRADHRAVLGGMLADLSDFLPPLLRRLDRMSMGSSVECRVPFLDHRLVHQCINLPMPYRVGARADKWILRQIALRYIPGGLAKRKKMGFPLPLGDYVRPFATADFFAGGFCEQELGLSRRGLEHLVGGWERRLHFFFGLVTLEIWGRLYIRRQRPELVDEDIRKLEHDQKSKAA